jgi:hypothetical protein
MNRHAMKLRAGNAMDKRARRLRDVAMSVLRSKGTSFAVGLATATVYRRGALTVRYWPSKGQLEVWYGNKVLVTERREGMPHAVLYEPGIWERELEAEAPQRPKRVSVTRQAAG